MTELARKLGIAPSSAHRLLATLVKTGYAQPEPGTGRYRRGPALVRLASRAAPPPLLREAARPILRRLAEATGETAHLAILEGSSVVALDHVSPSAGAAAEHAVGARIPAHATALGLALLAHRMDVAEAVMSGELVRWTRDTIADREALDQRLDEVRRRGYAVNVRGWREGTAGVAAPILLPDGRAIGAVGLSGPASRMSRKATLSELGPLVARAAREIATRLGTTIPDHPGGD